MGLSELRSDALEAVPTPKSRPDGPPKVAVFGAGIAGLTAAHELAERGFEVWIYEPTKDARFEADKKAGAKAVKAAKAAKAARAAKASTDVLLRIGGMAATQYLTAPWLTGGATATVSQARWNDRLDSEQASKSDGRARLPLLPRVLPSHLGHAPAHTHS